jgi:cell division protein FtsW
MYQPYHSKKRNRALYIYILSAALLCIIGIISIYSASSIFAFKRFGTTQYYLYRELIGLVLGSIALMCASILPLHYIQRLSFFFLLCALMLTACTLLTTHAVAIHGSSRWLKLGPLALQPSEFLKYATIVYLADFFARKDIRSHAAQKLWIGFLLIMALVSTVLLAQPDFGMTVIIWITALAMAYVAGIAGRHLCYGVMAFVPFCLLLILCKPYRLQRVLTYLNPWSDRQGAGFQIIQSLIAIGSGNVAGVGIGQSKQKFFYLPMQHTDFIFSIMAEETGFIGGSCVIILYMLFIYSGLRLAAQQQSLFGRYLIVGFTLTVAVQACMNLAITMGLLPTKGIGLPFISYGNSSLIASLAMLGLVINCVRNDQTATKMYVYR